MATRALHHGSKKLASSNSSLAPRAVISLLCAVSLYFCFSLFRKDAPPPSLLNPVVPAKSSGSNCNYSDGRWIYDSSIRSPPRYDHTCKEIFKGWNCIASNKSNAIDILRWRWKPHGCDLPPFDPLRFLEQFRDTSIGECTSEFTTALSKLTVLCIFGYLFRILCLGMLLDTLN